MKKFWIIIVGMTILIPALVFAVEEDTERRVEEKNRRLLDTNVEEKLKEVESFEYRFGGWVFSRYTDYDDSDNDKTLDDTLDDSLFLDTRLWALIAYESEEMVKENRKHHLYLRLKNLYFDREGTAPRYSSDNVGPHLDYLYADLDYRPWQFRFGRNYVNIGRGIALNDVYDAVQVNYKRPAWNVGLLAGHILPHQENIDTSVPGYEKESDRYFFGLGLGYAGVKNQEFYGFVISQEDFSNPDPESTQEYTYDSQYFGLGARGVIIKDVAYWLEVIRQTGESRVFGTNAKSDINAWAFDFLVEAQTQWWFQPLWSLEYAFGSGDADRTSVTDTEFGNSSGDDHNFLYFGYIDTGFALSPQLSNLHLLRLGVDILPFKNSEYLNKVSVGVYYYRFWKDEKEGGISDLNASNPDSDIGQEIDFQIQYDLNKTTSITLEYGCFMPGDAFVSDADDSERYTSVSVTKLF